jgi:photosystem II stability/assembly factor-like uncharacterized protein
VRHPVLLTRSASLIGWLILIPVLLGPLRLLVVAQEVDLAQEVGPRERQAWFYGQRAYPLRRLPRGARIRALQKMSWMKRQEETASQSLHIDASSTSWTQIGPQPTSWCLPGLCNPTSGRVTALAEDTSDPSGNTVYIGGAEGGVWKTTDGGTNWSPLTDGQFSLAVGSIAVDPNNHANVYVGTGEENFNVDAYYGAGVLRSTDGGSTWSHVGSKTFGGPLDPGSGGSFIGSIAVQPGVSSGTPIILVSSQYSSGVNSFRSGVWRSTDGGSTWSPVLPVTMDENAVATSLFFVNNTTAYAAIGYLLGDSNNGVYKSTDAGQTWTAVNGIGTTAIVSGLNAGRITLHSAPSNTSTLYVAIQSPSSYGLAGMFVSLDAGNTWQPMHTPLGTGGGGSTGDFCGNQCWYDMTLAVSPSNPSLVYAGGGFNSGGLFMSKDGGMSWSSISPGTHADFHTLLFAGGGKTLYVGNDGGVWKTSNVGTSAVSWSNLNSTLALTQFYPGLSISANDVNVSLGGTQDNGTQEYTGSLAWNIVGICGDGMWTAINPTNLNIMYSRCAQPHITKSTDGGTTWFEISSGITDSSFFLSPFVMDLIHPNNLYFGTMRVWQTTNGGGTWVPASPSLSTTGRLITTLAVSPTSSSTIYAGNYDPQLWFTTDNGTTWRRVTGGFPPRYPTMIQGDPNVIGTFYATFSGFSGFGADTKGHVFKCMTASSTCNDISSNLPNIPVNDIVIDPDSTNTYYVASDIGVFKTTNGGSTWTTFSNGLPNVAVLSLKLQRSSRILRAATHGRSVWDIVVQGLPDLVETSISNPASTVLDGGSFSVTDTVQNIGSAAAAASTTRYYLSTTTSKSGAHLLTGSRAVPSLVSAATSSGTMTVAVNAGTAAGTYFLLACTDDTKLVSETNEGNNCKASTNKATVSGPDLTETSVTNPPAAIVDGGSFSVTDAVQNIGSAAAAASTTRYYLSTTTSKSGAHLLTRSRALPSLVSAATSSGTMTASVNAGTAAGTYFLLACADDTKLVSETDEGNNCKASASQVAVSGPDLVETSVSNPPVTVTPGGLFSVTDTAQNIGSAAAAASTTRYYLSTTTSRSTGSILLAGTRSILSLAPAATSSGNASVAVPSTLPNGTYFLLACSDDTKLVSETNEKNNCSASATTTMH